MGGGAAFRMEMQRCRLITYTYDQIGQKYLDVGVPDILTALTDRIESLLGGGSGPLPLA